MVAADASPKGHVSMWCIRSWRRLRTVEVRARHANTRAKSSMRGLPYQIGYNSCVGCMIGMLMNARKGFAQGGLKDCVQKGV